MLLSPFPLLPELVAFVSFFADIKDGFMRVFSDLSPLTCLTSTAFIVLVAAFVALGRLCVYVDDHSRTFIAVVR